MTTIRNSRHQESTALSEDSALARRIMYAIRRQAAAIAADKELQLVAFRGWIVAGAVMLVGVFGLRFSNWMADLRATYGPSVDIATGLVMGLILTGYLCMLVVSNFDRGSRLLRHK